MLKEHLFWFWRGILLDTYSFWENSLNLTPRWRQPRFVDILSISSSGIVTFNSLLFYNLWQLSTEPENKINTIVIDFFNLELEQSIQNDQIGPFNFILNLVHAVMNKGLTTLHYIVLHCPVK